MKINKPRYTYVFMAAFGFILFTALFTILPTKTASALSTTFTWVDKYHITAVGSDFDPSPATFQASASTAIGSGVLSSYGAIGGVKLKQPNCSASVRLTNVSADGKQATLTVTNPPIVSSPGSTVPRVCTDAEISSYKNASVSLGSSEKATTTPTNENSNSQSATVWVYPNASKTNAKATGNAPKTDTITIKNSKGKEIQKQVVDVDNTYNCQDFDATCSGVIRYWHIFSNLPAGKYTACSVVAKNCVDFTKKFN